MSSVLSVALLFVGLAALVLIHVFIVRRAVRRALEAIAGGGRCGLSPEELEKLPCYDYKGSGAGDADCAVCLEGFQAGDRCRLLPLCGHSFHAQCVESWLLRSAVCPICRSSADARTRQAAAAVEQRPPVMVGFPVGSGPEPLRGSVSG